LLADRIAIADAEMMTVADERPLPADRTKSRSDRAPSALADSIGADDRVPMPRDRR
jgi:hypothetical protein